MARPPVNSGCEAVMPRLKLYSDANTRVTDGCENIDEQPQPPVAFGFLNVKPDPITLVT